MDRRTFLRTTGLTAAAVAFATDTVTATTGRGIVPVQIKTDDHGVSHLYADDEAALAYANGYVQARDRLFQMDVLRHVGYGDSASLLGESQLQSDVEVRRDLYSRAEIEQQYEAASDRTRGLLDAFADGVNHKMTELAVTGQLPGEFVALAHAPDPWEPEDSIAVLSYLIGRFGVSGGDELANARTFARLRQSLGDAEAAYEAFGDLNWLRVRDTHTPSVPPSDLVVDGDEDVLPYVDVPADQLGYVDAALDAEPWGIDPEAASSATSTSLRDAVRRVAGDVGLPGVGGAATGIVEGFHFGSNALVVGGEHTTTGQPMLAGGPQMGYFKPPVVYQVGLHGDGFDAAGIGVVGAPGIIIGRTPGFAWTVTSGRDDQVDTIAVDLHPTDRHRYRWDGEWREMTTETVTHEVSLIASIIDGDPTTETVEQEVARIEEDGSVMPVVAWNPDERVAWCQRTTTRYDEVEAAFMWADIARQDDLDGVTTQLADFPFTFNFHYADADDVSFVHTGKVPERNPALDHRLPAPADRHEWSGMRVGLGLDTHVTNPSTGYVANWNNAPCHGWRAGDAPRNWGSIHRGELLDELAQDAIADGPLSLAAVEAIVDRASTRDAAARYTVPALVDAAVASGDERLAAMADELSAWQTTDYSWVDGDGDGRYDSAGMAIWEATRRALQSLVVGDELGEATPELAFDPPLARHAEHHGNAEQDVVIVDALGGETAHDWFDGDPAAVLEAALEQAATALEARFGSPDPADWRLAVRSCTFRSLGASLETSIAMLNRASYNQAIALGEGLDGSKHVLPPSNTGHLSLDEVLAAVVGGDEPDRLTDQLDEYTAFDYVPHPVTTAEVDAVATDERTLWALAGTAATRERTAATRERTADAVDRRTEFDPTARRLAVHAITSQDDRRD